MKEKKLEELIERKEQKLLLSPFCGATKILREGMLDAYLLGIKKEKKNKQIIN